MLNEIRVSVGIFVYNGMPFIKDAIDSILQQSYKVNEIVISDNCSTDETYQTIIRFRNDFPQYRWLINKNSSNLGFVENAKKVIELITNEFMILLHADDILKPDMVEKQLTFFRNHPELVLIGGYDDSIDGDGNLIKQHNSIPDLIFQQGNVNEFIRVTNSYIPFSTVMHRTEILRKIELNFDSLIADEIYWPKVLQYHPIAVLGTALTSRRYHSRNTTHTYNLDYDRNIIEINRHLEIAEYEPGRRKEIRSFLTYKYANNSLSNFLNLLFRFKVFEACRFLALAARLHPSIFFKTNFLYQYLSRIPIKIYKVLFCRKKRS